jgi:hypothetical protein
MRRIDADLESLQPVAVPQALEREAVARRRDEGVERGQLRRHRALRAQPGEDDARADPGRIAALADAGAQGRAGRLGRRLEAAAVDRELPAVERTAQALGFEAAEAQVGAAVRAGPVDQAPALLAVAKQHQVLAEQAHRLHRARGHARVEARFELVDQRRRLPVAAHQVAAGRARADARDQFVLLGVHGDIREAGRSV